MKSIKILFITAEYSERGAGGAGVYAWEITKAIAKKGIEIHVLAPDIYSHDENPQKNLFIHYKKTYFRRLLRMPSFSLQVLKSWRKIVNNYQITSVHSNNNAGVLINKNIPMVTIIQHPAIIEMAQFSIVQRLLNLIDVQLEKIIVQKSALVIATCHITYNKLLFYYPTIRNKLTILPIGIDFSIYRSTRRPKNNMFTMFFPGGARARRKGAEYLFPALEKLKRETDFRVIITGSSREIGWENEFKSLLRRYNLEKNVELMGEVKYFEIVGIYNKVDLVVFPSTFEGYGIPVLESLAMSKPVIATKTGEAPHIIKDGINGFLVSPRDSQAIFHIINRLINDTSLLHKLAINARKTVIEKYSWSNISKEYIKLYEKFTK